MTQWHMKSKRKSTGGLRYSLRRSDKKLAWRGGEFSHTKLSAEEKRKVVKGRGNTTKVKLREVKFANVSDDKGKAHKVELKNVLENTANRHYARMQIVTKGALIEGLMNGKKILVRITSRPGQSGVAQGVFLKEEEISALETKKGLKKSKKSEERHAEAKKEQEHKEEHHAPKEEKLEEKGHKEKKPAKAHKK